MNLPLMPPRRPDAHKGDFGKILVIGGSRAMPGAAALAAYSALKSGAGLVKVAVPFSAAPSVAAHCPCYTQLPCPETEEGGFSRKAIPIISNEAAEADVLAIGPGISTGTETKDTVLEIIEGSDRPIVIDADALTITAQDADVVIRRKFLSVLTPHPGEFARLDGKKPPRSEEGRVKAAARLAEKTGAIVVLKGKGTVVTDSQMHHIVATGNPGMATAGSGDVLTGIIAAFLAVLPHGLEAVALAAHIHGLAGDLAAEQTGEISLTASDILDYIPEAIKLHQRSD